jgi:hypothetical protein
MSGVVVSFHAGCLSGNLCLAVWDPTVGRYKGFDLYACQRYYRQAVSHPETASTPVHIGPVDTGCPSGRLSVSLLTGIAGRFTV